MALVINQETFDSAVEENINEFGMSREEAIADAIKQFEVQGVDLTNILSKIMTLKPEDTKTLATSVNELKKLTKSKGEPTPAQYENQLSIIKTECEKGLEYRVFAGKEGAYDVLLDILLKNTADVNLTKSTLNCMLSLMTKQPDLLDSSGVQVMNNYLDNAKDSTIHKLILKWAKECCVMHEENRQKIFDAGILERLKKLLQNADSGMLQDVLGVLRSLVLDDDVRVEFGRAHEHARVIASDTLCSITGMLSKFMHDEPLMIDVLLTLSSLIVRTEFCTKVEDAGGLDTIKDIMITFQKKDKIINQCFKLLKRLAGNDDVKIHIIQKQMAPVITASLDTNKNSAVTAAAGLSCVAALSLRSPDNSKAFYESSVPEVIVNAMKQHIEDKNVQRNGSWAVRNMVSRSHYQIQTFLDLGIEEILVHNLKKFPTCEYDIKSALRDLGCKVQLKEEWTGKGGRITTQAKK